MKTFVIKIIANSDEKDPELLHWREGKRGLLKVSEDSFLIGGEELLLTEIVSAQLVIIPSALFISNMILSLHMKSGIVHHIKTTYDPYWRREFPFPVMISTGYAAFLWVRRLGLLVMVLWLFWALFLLE